jgi:hypothetical protein
MARSREAFGYTEPAPKDAQCHACNAFRASLSGCHLFYELTRLMPRLFQITTTVDQHGGCKAFERGSYSDRLFMLSRIVGAVKGKS